MPTTSRPAARRPPDPPGPGSASLEPLVLGLAAFLFAVHVAVNLTGPYGFHRDEFLYLAMGEHLRLWRMDFPPFIAIVARLTRATIADSLVAIRLAPALAASALVFLAAAIARELGGRRFAQVTAALTVVASPLFLRTGNLFQPVVLDQLWWTLALYALVRLGRESRMRWWILLGLAGGLGLLTKFSMLFFGASLLGALIVSPMRRSLLTPGPWVALLLALVIGSPSLAGQIALGWPVLGQLQELRTAQLEHVSPAGYLTGQLLYGPAVALALAGAAWLLAAPAARAWRAVGWACVLAFLLLLVIHGKPYYIGPIYPTLFAAGAVVLQAVRGLSGKALRAATVGLVTGYGALTLPLGLPILRPPTMIRYLAALGSRDAVRTNSGTTLALPQDYADMLGWDSLATATARVYHALPAADQSRAVIIADNYGEAGAIDLLGRRLGLPPVVSPAGSYWFFGPGTRPGEIAVAVGVTADDLKPFYARITPALVVRNPLGVEEEQEVTIFVCEYPVRTLQQVWPGLAGQN